MANIALGNSKRVALVDDQDLPLISDYSWHEKRDGTRVYAAAWVKGKSTNVLLHRVIMNPTPDEIIDHINRDGLDNRRCNLRIVSHQQNMWNSRPHNGRTYKGVFRKLSGRWYATIKNKYLGMYDTQEDAARAYNTEAKVQFGEYAYLNPLPDNLSLLRGWRKNVPRDRRLLVRLFHIVRDYSFRFIHKIGGNRL